MNELEWRPNLRQRVSAALTMLRDRSLMKRAGGKAVAYTSDGQQIQGTIYYPETECRTPAVLLLHTASGLTPHEHAIAARLATEGYAALVIGYSKRTRGAILSDDDQRKRLEDITMGGLRFLQEDPRVDAKKTAVIGFSLGGYFAIQLAGARLNIPPAAVVIYYGVFQTTESQVDSLRAPLLILQGEDDASHFVADAKKIRDLAQTYGKACELILYPGVGHLFDWFEPHSQTTHDAWIKTLAFLRGHLNS